MLFAAACLALRPGGGLLRGSLAQQPQVQRVLPRPPPAMPNRQPTSAPIVANHGNRTTAIVKQECLLYSADVKNSIRSSDGSAVMSVVLVDDQVGPAVGAVDVRNLSLVHSRLGALLITLQWLPYAQQLEVTNPREIEEIANASAILKDIRQGGPGSNMSSVSFIDGVNNTIGYERTDNLRGDFIPATPLSIFSEMALPSRGRWVLLVEDAGSSYKNRSVELLGWKLVLCPPVNQSLPVNLREQVVKKVAAAGKLDLSSARSGGAFSATMRQAAAGDGRGPFGALGSGAQPLVAAIGSLVTRNAKIQYKSYTELADEAVEAAIRAQNNFQRLYGLPNELTPLINKGLPWVELFIDNTSPPAKRHRRHDSKPGLAGQDSLLGVATRDGPNGPVVVNKKLLQREMCSIMMPLEFAQYTSSDDEEVAELTDSNSDDDYVDEEVDDEGSSDDESRRRRRGLAGLLGPSSSLRFPTPLAPLDFTEAPLFPQAGGGLRAPLELQRALLDGGWPAGRGGSGPLLGGRPGNPNVIPLQESPDEPVLGQPWDTVGGTNQRDRAGREPRTIGRPNPDAINQIIERSFNNIEAGVYNDAVLSELKAAVNRGERASSTLDAVAASAELLSRGGDAAVQTAQALKASADTYTEILRAGEESLQRFNEPQMQNWTREWLKSGGVNQEFEGMKRAAKKRNQQPNTVDRFTWLFSR
ncbi:hypothetical protein VOLCADRAFT_98052 [Volvox carteri f. nagariensis]|uniref:Uncharacterized protein n=1 Tax=Volvox carteri f. nagariensis TaxID=3068 RepID=D8UEB4_VOLCA|nr:uncharacterized protein VOLCADRAFT_98052 [Volvox carteri f. nagariensis]EFJ41975.1 hypothetical protein VOLCADRAFT_98052 [Volvox carteri f. nagariensis]|eukprot:XP_002957012.1 hypothetical protein VOLCADRAFT_98052 [Volvox carteri f. nagariensis]